ncbi:TATA-box-binding protein [archaeon]|nr:TATA-box-binding protein [archaeon]|tara:strand:+ start:4174 stop:4731 length:558 start_codon:yes stop_codon:yes gene_type:complete
MVKIVNIVASTRYAGSIDVNEVADLLHIDYEQEQFPGMVYRVENPKVCILLFRSGKAVATGAKDVESITVAFNILRDELDKHDFELWPKESCEIVTHNIVTTCDISDVMDENKINLSNLMILLPFEKTEYEPEQFPGLIYRIDEPKVVYLIFSSGRCVITGSKDFEEAKEAELILRDTIKETLFI